METKDYLTNYYERYDENGRLISKHGMVEYLKFYENCGMTDRIRRMEYRMEE